MPTQQSKLIDMMTDDNLQSAYVPISQQEKEKGAGFMIPGIGTGYQFNPSDYYGVPHVNQGQVGTGWGMFGGGMPGGVPQQNTMSAIDQALGWDQIPGGGLPGDPDVSGPVGGQLGWGDFGKTIGSMLLGVLTGNPLAVILGARNAANLDSGYGVVGPDPSLGFGGWGQVGDLGGGWDDGGWGGFGAGNAAGTVGDTGLPAGLLWGGDAGQGGLGGSAGGLGGVGMGGGTGGLAGIY